MSFDGFMFFTNIEAIKKCYENETAIYKQGSVTKPL